MKTNTVLLIFFAMAWIILSGCEEKEVKFRYMGEKVLCKGFSANWYIENSKKKEVYSFTAILNGREYIVKERISIWGESKHYNTYFQLLPDDDPYTTNITKVFELWQDSVIVLIMRATSSNGRIYESNPITMKHDDCTVLILDYPLTDCMLLRGNVNFGWHIKYPKKGVTYNFTLIHDLGKSTHDSIYVGSRTECAVKPLYRLSRGYSGIWWSVEAKGSDGTAYKAARRGIICELPTSGPNGLKVILDGPPNRSRLPEGYITFRWHLENAKRGVRYNYVILFDKGVNPFDHSIEKWIDVGESRQYTCYMSADWWSVGFGWGIVVEDSGEPLCHSEARSITIIRE